MNRSGRLLSAIFVTAAFCLLPTASFSGGQKAGNAKPGAGLSGKSAGQRSHSKTEQQELQLLKLILADIKTAQHVPVSFVPVNPDGTFGDPTATMNVQGGSTYTYTVTFPREIPTTFTIRYETSNVTPLPSRPVTTSRSVTAYTISVTAPTQQGAAIPHYFVVHASYTLGGTNYDEHGAAVGVSQ